MRDVGQDSRADAHRLPPVPRDGRAQHGMMVTSLGFISPLLPFSMAPGGFHCGLETFDPSLPAPSLCSALPASQDARTQLSSFKADGCVPHARLSVLGNTITFHKEGSC